MSLPPAVLEEQQRLQKAAVAVAERPAETPKLQLLVNPDMLRSRMQVAEAFHAQLLEEGEWSPGQRVPRNAAKRFIATLMWKKNSCEDPESYGAEVVQVLGELCALAEAAVAVRYFQERRLC